jgi:flagellar basal-body rod protein FlgC
MDVIAGNLANAESTRTSEGGPYQRQQVVFKAVMNEATGNGSSAGAGVAVAIVGSDQRAPLKVYMPGHPDADANGIVLMPDVRPAEEMADMVSASRSYEANAAALKIGRMMFQKALDLGRA